MNAYYDKKFRLLVPGSLVRLYFADLKIANNKIKEINIPENNVIYALVYQKEDEIILIDAIGEEYPEYLSEPGVPLQDVEIVEK